MNRVSFSQTIPQEFYFFDCPDCGIVFGISQDFRRRREQDAGKIYCPKGHICSYAVSEEDRLRKRLEGEKRLRLETEGQLTTEKGYTKKLRAEKSALKGVATKMKKRVSAGVCICCNRTFKNVARHMESQHPDYVGKGK